MTLYYVDTERNREEEKGIFRYYKRYATCPQGSLATDQPALGSKMPGHSEDFSPVLVDVSVDQDRSTGSLYYLNLTFRDWIAR